MKRLLSILTMFLVTIMLSGCVLSRTPSKNPVLLLPGQSKTFTVKLSKVPINYVWTVDGVVVSKVEPATSASSSFTYTMSGLAPYEHTIAVCASQHIFADLIEDDVATWDVQLGISNNTPPVANAGPDINYMSGGTGTLDGSASYDPDEDLITYQWTQTNGPAVTWLTGTDIVNPQFTANVPVGSSLTFQLTVSDEVGLQSTDTCIVNIVPGPVFLGPSPYLSFSDSPFNTLTFTYFYLENFEDQLLNTPGVSVEGGTMGITGHPCADSVDADDGVIDGSGTMGTSYYSASSSSITFSFNESVLGSFPTHVGLVWTDAGGYGDVTFTTYGVDGSSLGSITANHLGDGDVTGGTAEDRFFGVINESGVSKITMYVPGTDWECDHLQYGR